MSHTLKQTKKQKKTIKSAKIFNGLTDTTEKISVKWPVRQLSDEDAC